MNKIKIVKFIFSFFAIMLPFLLIGEVYHSYLSESFLYFGDLVEIDFTEVSKEECESTLSAVATQNNGYIIQVDFKAKSDNEETYKIYATPGGKEYIYKKYKITDGKYKSLFSEKLDIAIKDISTSPGLIRDDVYIILGDERTKNGIITDLSEKAELHGHSKASSMIGWYLKLFFIIFLPYAFLLIVSKFEIDSACKEVKIKIVFGCSAINEALKHIFIDTILFSVIFIAGLLLLNKFLGIFFGKFIIAGMFLVLVLVNALFYSAYFDRDIRKVFSSATNSFSLLSIAYLLKAITLVVCIIAISISFGNFIKFRDIAHFKSDIAQYKDYSFIEVGKLDKYGEATDVIDVILFDTFKIRGEIYSDYYESCDPVLISDAEGPIFANSNARDFILKNIKGIDSSQLNDEKVYLLIPEELKSNTDLYVTQMNDFFDIYSDDFKWEHQIVYYQSSDIAIFGSAGYEDGNIHISRVKDEVVIFNNYSGENLGDMTSGELKTLFPFIMFNMDSDTFNSIVEKYSLSNDLSAITSVGEVYLNEYNNFRNKFYLSFSSSMLLIVLQFMLSATIIRLNYIANAKELAIKKVLGYSIFSKNRKIMTIIICSVLVGTISALIICNQFNLSDPLYSLPIGMFILIFEILMMFIFAQNFERQNVQKILKGGAL